MSVPSITKTEREQLINDHLYLVKYIVDRLDYLAWGDLVSHEDLISYGTIGLINAVDKYNSEKGTLKSFAYPRIRGAIIDHLRSLDYLKRGSRQKVKQLNAATKKLEQELGAIPSNKQIAEELGISNNDLLSIQQDVSVNFLSMNASLDGSDEELSDFIADESSSPEQDCEKSLLYEQLRKAINELPEKEKIILGLYHFRKLNMRKIAEMLKISESRVCQLHNRGLSLLRSKLSQ